MVSMLMLTVQRSAVAARAYWVGSGEKEIYSGLALYYLYHLPLPIKSCCTSPDCLEQENPVGEEVHADMRC